MDTLIDDTDLGPPETAATPSEASSLRCPGCGFWSLWPVAAAEIPGCAGCGRALPWVIDGTTASFEASVDTPLLVLVEFWTGWSGPSLSMTPLLERLAERHAGRLKVIRIEAEQEPGLGIRYRATGTPLLVILADGEEVDRRAGRAPESRLTRWIDRWVTQHSRNAGEPAEE